ATSAPAWPTWTGPPAVWCDATNASGPASWCRWTSTSSATSLTEEDTERWDDPRVARTAPKPDRPTSTTLWTTTPVWPTASYWPTRRKRPATGFWKRAHTYFSSVGITVERVLTDNGACYKSHIWRDLLAGQGVKHKRTHPYRPQTNGKVERFNRTLVEEWAYARPYRSESKKRQASAGWLLRHHPSCSPEARSFIPGW